MVEEAMIALETFLRSLMTIQECRSHTLTVTRDDRSNLKIKIVPVGYEGRRCWSGKVKGDSVLPDVTKHCENDE
jgi:hypothetical protein